MDKILLLSNISVISILVFILMLICILYGGGRDPSCISTGCVKSSSSGNKTAATVPTFDPAYNYVCGINCGTCSPSNAVKSTDIDSTGKKYAYSYCKKCSTGFSLDPTKNSTVPASGLVASDFYCT